MATMTIAKFALFDVPRATSGFGHHRWRRGRE